MLVSLCLGGLLHTSSYETATKNASASTTETTCHGNAAANAPSKTYAASRPSTETPTYDDDDHMKLFISRYFLLLFDKSVISYMIVMFEFMHLWITLLVMCMRNIMFMKIFVEGMRHVVHRLNRTTLVMNMVWIILLLPWHWLGVCS
jgi:hypothetical protein